MLNVLHISLMNTHFLKRTVITLGGGLLNSSFLPLIFVILFSFCLTFLTILEEGERMINPLIYSKCIAFFSFTDISF